MKTLLTNKTYHALGPHADLIHSKIHREIFVIELGDPKCS
jgi:hypothetical protein